MSVINTNYKYVYEKGSFIVCDECSELSHDEWRVNYYHEICESCYFNFHTYGEKS